VTNSSLRVKNAKLSYGKFHEKGNKEKDVPASTINNIIISSKGEAVISSCGRSDSPSGTEGSFEIWDGDIKVGLYYWDCPWASKINKSAWTTDNEAYLGECTGANLYAGALGNVTIRIIKDQKT
jgi:Aegerolysin